MVCLADTKDSKPVSRSSELSQSGYRYYSASLGRWASRDPIAERGSITLIPPDRALDRLLNAMAGPGTDDYTFCGNGSVDNMDALGLGYIDIDDSCTAGDLASLALFYKPEKDEDGKKKPIKTPGRIDGIDGLCMPVQGRWIKVPTVSGWITVKCKHKDCPKRTIVSVDFGWSPFVGLGYWLFRKSPPGEYFFPDKPPGGWPDCTL